MNRRDVRNVLLAISWGAFMSALVGIVSVLLGAPRPLPGCVLSFVMAATQAWLFFDRIGRRGER